MPYNQVSAMGVQHGLVSPQDEMAMRMAQMQALQSGLGAGGGAPRPDGGAGNDQFARDFAAAHPQDNWDQQRNEGIDDFHRQLNAATALQTLAGNQQMDLSKESTNRALGVTGLEMQPKLMEQQREQAQFNEATPFRQRIEQEKMNALNGSPSNDNDLLRYSILGVNTTPLLEQRNMQQQHQWDLDAANRSAQMELMKNLAQSQDPAQRQLGLQMMGKLTGQNFEPEQTATLMKPSPTFGATVVQNNPQIDFALNQLGKKSNDLATTFGGQPEAVTAKVQGWVDDAVKQFVAAGIPEDQARTLIYKKLDEVLPERKSPAALAIREVLRDGLTAGIGAFTSSDAERSTALRNQFGIQ